MSLREQLQALQAGAKDRIPADLLAIMHAENEKLIASGTADSAVAVGDQAPDFTLPNATGQPRSLADLLTDGPVVLTFYRGAWCPFCNLELRALQAHVADFAAHAATLVAVSPQVPDESVSLREKHGLTFDVLSDVGSQVAKTYGLAFDLSDELAGVYDRLSFELTRVNGGHPRTLPIPATYVIDRGGVVRWAFTNADYRQRAEPADILNALAAHS